MLAAKRIRSGRFLKDEVGRLKDDSRLHPIRLRNNGLFQIANAAAQADQRGAPENRVGRDRRRGHGLVAAWVAQGTARPRFDRRARWIGLRVSAAAQSRRNFAAAPLLPLRSRRARRSLDAYRLGAEICDPYRLARAGLIHQPGQVFGRLDRSIAESRDHGVEWNARLSAGESRTRDTTQALALSRAACRRRQPSAHRLRERTPRSCLRAAGPS